MKKTIIIITLLAATVVIAVPVRSMVAARNTVAAASEQQQYTAADYIQDGLIAMWDGIENAGWGIHDSNATSWTDLIGSVHISTGHASWNDNSCFTNTPYAAYSIPAKNSSIVSRLISGVSNNYYLVDNMTIEMGFCITNPYMAMYVPFSLSNTDYNSGISYVTPWSSPRIGFVPSYANAYTDYGRYKMISSIQNIFTTISGTFSKVNNEVVTKEYFNGDKTINEKIFNSNFVFDNRYSTVICIFPGYTYFIRIYNRGLSSEEVKYNYKIDKSRFNLR